MDTRVARLLSAAADKGREVLVLVQFPSPSPKIDQLPRAQPPFLLVASPSPCPPKHDGFAKAGQNTTGPHACTPSNLMPT
jgi:hypothetical protein